MGYVIRGLFVGALRESLYTVYLTLASAWNRRAVRFLLVACLLGWLVTKIDPRALLDHLGQFDPRAGFIMLTIFLLTLCAFALRWWMIAGLLGIRAEYSRFLRALWVSQCVAEAGPPLVVGELARYRMMRDCGEFWPLAASQAVDRFSGKLALLAIVLVLLPGYLEWYRDFPLLRVAAFAILVLGLAGLVWLVLRGFGGKVGLHPAVVLAAANPLRAPGHYGLSLLIQALLSANFAIAAWGLGIANIVGVWRASPLLLLGVGSVPGAVSDWGKREVIALALFSPLGLAPEQCLALSLLYGAMHLFAALPGAWLLAAAGAWDKSARTGVGER